jgi:REP element-mobilizing transposase RayT
VVEPYARLFLKTLYGYKRQGRFQLHAFVVMPEHVHLVLTPAIDVTLGARNAVHQGRIFAYGRRGQTPRFLASLRNDSA